MHIDIISRRKLLCPEDIDSQLSYLANPLIVSFGKNRKRLFFNSRDSFNRSSIFSVELVSDNFRYVKSTLTLEQSYGPSDSYFSHGVSIGSSFKFKESQYLAVMGWHIPQDGHWRGEIGLLSISSDGHISSIGDTPWIPLSKNDPISLSYPGIYVEEDELYVWYGSTVSWDIGNSEILHILKEGKTTIGGRELFSIRELPYLIGSAQAFSKPSVLSIGGRKLMAYSFREPCKTYRIGFVWLDDLKTASHLGGIAPVTPTDEIWEDEMVEYPHLFENSGKIFMLYNGNRFGQTGVGLIELSISP